jgi:hypothetical protein
MLKDRGLIKWQAAAFLPQQGEMARRMWSEMEREPKPEVDEYLAAEFEERVCFAMEANLTVVFSVWVDGVTTAVIGNVHVADELRREYRVETDGGFVSVPFEAVVGVSVED